MYLILFGLASALAWGTSDFAGGLASRRSASYLVTLVTNACAVAFLVPAALYLNEPNLPPVGFGLCLVGGAADSLALVILYAALAKGQLLAAPITALTAAALPVLVGMLTEGVPKPAILVGLGLALVAVWLLSQDDAGLERSRAAFADLCLPLLAGGLIGLFLILMHRGAHQQVIWPMVAMRLGGIAVLLPFILTKRRGRSREPFPWFLVGVIFFFDVGGTACYIRAGQAGRMDVAAVLSSLYPGMTVFLSWLLLRERVTGMHLAGVLAALGATALLTL